MRKKKKKKSTGQAALPGGKLFFVHRSLDSALLCRMPEFRRILDNKGSGILSVCELVL